MAIALVKSKDISPARLAAFNILKQVESGAFSSVLLAEHEPHLQTSDRALCHELVLGVLRWQLHLDKLIEHYAKRDAERLDVPVRIALRLGFYQLRFLTRIPPSAAVDESVKLVRAARLSSATGLVNAVLRRAIREPEYDPAAGVSDPLERISLQTSHPLWLIDRWAGSFGLAETEAFATANNLVPPTAFRVVASRATASEVLSKLNEAGATVESSAVVDDAWRVTGATSVVRELNAAGEIYLQDEASQLVARMLAAETGNRVLDLCAAPGGKTSLIADTTGDRALVVAADRSATRMATVVATSQLHQLNGIKPVLLDASEQLPFESGSFDCVLVDAPCSGTGTLRGNPEIRWRLTPVDMTSLAKQQQQILNQALRMLKPGGRLVYSTCSVEVEENEDVIAKVIDDRFEVLRTIRTWPQHEGCDGFFMAAVEFRQDSRDKTGLTR